MTDRTGNHDSERRPREPRLCLFFIRAAARFVPGSRRERWLDQWTADTIYRARCRAERQRGRIRIGGSTISWLLGALTHAWYLFWREYTVDIIWQDVKYGLRALRRGRSLIVMAVLSLALGIAACATIFSIVDVFMLRPLPYPEPDRLLAVWSTNAERGWNATSFSVADFLDLRERSTTLEVATIIQQGFSITPEEMPERVDGQLVSGDFFDVIGLEPLLGRGFTRAEEGPGQGGAVIISHALWQRWYGGDPDALGTTLRLDGVPVTLVGVMPPGFWFDQPEAKVWVPMPFDPDENRSNTYLRVVARLRPGVTIEQARSESESIITALAEEYPDANAGNGIFIDTLHHDIFDEGYRSGCLIASVAVLFLLLIACGNVANLLLTHAAGREKEVALRGALGAGRSRLVRQFLTESSLVALMGGIAGLVLAVVGIKAFLSIAPPYMPRLDEIGLNLRVVAFTAGIALLTGFLFGLTPALHSLRMNLVSALRNNQRGGEARRMPRIRKTLVVAEIALALALLVASGLLMQGYWKLRVADMDLDTSDVLTFETALPETDYPDLPSTERFYEAFMARLESLPGVEGAGAVSLLPSKANYATYYYPPGEAVTAETERLVANYRTILPGYFDALDIPLVRGRDLSADDREGSPLSLVINESMARRHWPDEDPVGQEIVLSTHPWRIIGVAADSRDGPLDDIIRPKIYLPALQTRRQSLYWLVETTQPFAPLVESIRAELADLDPDLPVFNIMSLEEHIGIDLGADLIMAKIMVVMAAIALILCLGGVYGVMAFMVSQRNREMGIRMALGACEGDVVRMVVGQGTRLALLGIVIGLALAAGVSSGLSHFLWGVSPFHPLTFGTVTVVLFAAALAATFFPARRATRVDPIAALRSE